MRGSRSSFIGALDLFEHVDKIEQPKKFALVINLTAKQMDVAFRRVFWRGRTR